MSYCGVMSLYLTGNGVAGSDINDRGEITVQAYDPNTGDTPAFQSVPTDQCEAGPSGSSTGQKVILPENIREQLRQRNGIGRAFRNRDDRRALK